MIVVLGNFCNDAQHLLSPAHYALGVVLRTCGSEKWRAGQYDRGMIHWSTNEALDVLKDST